MIKDLFITILIGFGLLALVRVVYGLETNTFAYTFSTFVDAFPLDSAQWKTWLEALDGYYGELYRLAVNAGNLKPANIAEFFEYFFVDGWKDFWQVVVTSFKLLAYMIADIFGIIGFILEFCFGEVVVPLGR